MTYGQLKLRGTKSAKLRQAPSQAATWDSYVRADAEALVAGRGSQMRPGGCKSISDKSNRPIALMHQSSNFSSRITRDEGYTASFSGQEAKVLSFAPFIPGKT